MLWLSYIHCSFDYPVKIAKIKCSKNKAVYSIPLFGLLLWPHPCQRCYDLKEVECTTHLFHIGFVIYFHLFSFDKTLPYLNYMYFQIISTYMGTTKWEVNHHSNQELIYNLKAKKFTWAYDSGVLWLLLNIDAVFNLACNTFILKIKHSQLSCRTHGQIPS